MKVLLFGATGMIGQGVLRECVLNADVKRALPRKGFDDDCQKKARSSGRHAEDDLLRSRCAEVATPGARR